MTETDDKAPDEKISSSASIELLKKVNTAANYCYACNRCNNVCPTAYLDIFYPRSLIVDLTFSTPEEALEKNDIWKCLTCGLCSVYCPMTKEEIGVNFTKIIKDLRSLASEYQPLQDGLLSCNHERVYSSLPKLMAEDKIKFTNKTGFLEGTGLKTTDKGEIAYFMGCVPFLSGTAPCVVGCPAGVDVQGYVSLISEGKYQESIDLIRDKNPLPYLCGRICTAQCALNCNRQHYDDPVAIRELKRFVSDWEAEHPNQSKIKPVPQTKEKIAIIGAGPGGLSAAYFLARMGYKPTIFEKGDKTGGVVRYGVPQYRLSDEALDHDVEFIKSMGVEIVFNKEFGPSFTLDDIWKEGFKAVFIAVGLYVPKTLRLEGEDLPNVHVALDFLLDRKCKCAENPDEYKGKTFGIIGGGAVALDSGETAIRLGATKADLVDILSEEALKNVLKDLHGAEQEVMEYHFETSTANITQEPDGKLALNCYKIEWGDPDPETGRRPLNKVEGSEFKIVVDHIVIAIGQGLDPEPLNAATDNKLKIERGKIVVDDMTYETGIPGVFAGGDIIYNSLMCAVDAIGDGRETAFTIDRYLRGLDLKKGRIVKSDLKRSTIPKKYILTNSCQEMNFMPGEERLVCFDEMELGFTEEQAKKEANRCLNCNLCCNSDQIPEDFEKSLDASGIMISNYGSQDNWSSLNAPDYLKIPKSVIGILNQNDIVPVVLPEEKCCGHDAIWRGDVETFKTLAEYNVNLFKSAGVKTLIFSCAEGYYTWKHEYKNLFKGKGEFDFEIYHITEYILKEKLLEDIAFPSLDKIKVTYHDPCRLGRMSSVFDAPRDVLKQIPAVELVEMEDTKQDAECCGVSAYISCNEDSKKLQEKKILQAIETGAEYLITACPKCIAHLNCYLNEHRELKEKIKVIDIVSFLGKLLFLM
ncbi:MAG: heterodisulfide reductase-related iron-sulfur binding cluster [Candidatus Hodarchaeales archaeon]|jgi:NADPH-dependent glutamate synthase beta subunit-like oxidoreductase/formate hydrogenlyase subunit 6/NADH:ubiquinone oxidoreductase subunit I